MKNFIICLFLLLFSFSSCRNEEPKITAEASTETKIDSLAMRYQELGRFSGSILVAKQDSVIFYKNYGLADYTAEEEFSENTAFKIGSLSQFYTEAIILDMVKKDLIGLENEVSVYIPEIKGSYTIRELLTHSSGLPDLPTIKEQNPDTKFSTVELANVAVVNPEKTPARSDLGYNLLGLVIEKVSEMTFQEVLEKYSAEWQLENTYLSRKDPKKEAKGYLYSNYRGEGLELQEAPEYDLNVAYSSSGLKSSIFDILKLTQITTRNTIEQNDYLQNDGFSYSLSKDAQAGLTVIVLSNRRHPVAREISNSIRSIYKSDPYKIPLARKQVAVNTESYSEYAGSYSLNPRMNLMVLNANDSLFLMMGTNKIHLIPQSETQFYMKENDASIEFIPNFNNAVSSAILYDGFLEGTEISKLPE